MKYFSVLMSLTLALLLGACAGTETSRPTGQVIDDASITTRVKTEIAQTAGLGQAAAINVSTYRGVVSLSGFVDTQQQIETATQAARRVAGVADVKNNLTIKPKS